MVLTTVAYAFLQRERMRHDIDPALTLPAARAIVTEIFTVLLYAQKPYYLKRIQELQKFSFGSNKVVLGCGNDCAPGP